MRRLLLLAPFVVLAGCAAGNPVPVVPPSALLPLGGGVQAVPWVNASAGFAVPMPWKVGADMWQLADYARFSIAVAPDRAAVFGVYAEDGRIEDALERWRAYFETLTGAAPALQPGERGVVYLEARGEVGSDNEGTFAIGAIRTAPAGNGVLVCALHGHATLLQLRRLDHLPAAVCVAATAPPVTTPPSDGELGP